MGLLSSTPPPSLSKVKCRGPGPILEGWEGRERQPGLKFPCPLPTSSSLAPGDISKGGSPRGITALLLCASWSFVSTHRTDFISIVWKCLFPLPDRERCSLKASVFLTSVSPAPAHCLPVTVYRTHVFGEKKKKMATQWNMFFIDGTDTHVLWTKSKQPKSNKRKNLLGVNPGKEKRHFSFFVFVFFSFLFFFLRKWQQYRLSNK